MSEEFYKKKTIKIDSEKNILHIDDKEIKFNFDVDAKKYFAYDYLPYVKFSTLEDLAKSIIDQGENS